MTQTDLTTRIVASVASLVTYYAFWQRQRRQDARIEHLECRLAGLRLDEVIRGGK